MRVESWILVAQIFERLSVYFFISDFTFLTYLLMKGVLDFLLIEVVSLVEANEFSDEFVESTSSSGGALFSSMSCFFARGVLSTVMVSFSQGCSPHDSGDAVSIRGSGVSGVSGLTGSTNRGLKQMFPMIFKGDCGSVGVSSDTRFSMLCVLSRKSLRSRSSSNKSSMLRDLRFLVLIDSSVGLAGSGVLSANAVSGSFESVRSSPSEGFLSSRSSPS